jgi:hypothetical protein
MTFLLYEKTSFKSHENSDFLKILPNTSPFPNFVGEKIIYTKANIKIITKWIKNKSIDGRLLAHF